MSLRLRLAGVVVEAQPRNAVPVAVTAGDKIESLRQWTSGRCLSADRAGGYSSAEVAGARSRKIVREPGMN